MTRNSGLTHAGLEMDPQSVGDKQIPRFVTYTSPVSLAPTANGIVRASTLPLNLVAHIVSFLEDIGDIARVTRTSKLLYYMTLPQLYRKVSLHSYAEMRYVQGRPEGYGSGSPVMMALNGLVTKAHAAQVLEFRIWGQWNDLGAEDFAKGRVPENSMMLNIVLRAAVDRMTRLQTFSWDLDCRPLKTLYQGLGAHHTLTSLTLRFPSSRQPRPSVMIPPMANLRAFRALDIDPLCYPDDMSIMLLSSRKLEDMRLHFSPRMRREAESSLNLDTYFGRLRTAGVQLRLKHLAMQNFYGPNTHGIASVLNPETCRSICFLDMFGGSSGNSKNVFFDATWKDPPLDIKTHFKMNRCNEPAAQHVLLLSNNSGMEQLYIVSAKAGPDTPLELATPGKSPVSEESVALGQQYLDALTRHHGSSLKRLLLSDQWALDEDQISHLVRFCPHLEQLGLNMDIENACTLRLLLPFLPKLYALRVLNSDIPTMPTANMTPEEQITKMSSELMKAGATHLRWLGLGSRVFKLGGNYQDDEGQWRIGVEEAAWDDARHVEIWGLDCLDIGADPVAPFSP